MTKTFSLLAAAMLLSTATFAQGRSKPTYIRSNTWQVQSFQPTAIQNELKATMQTTIGTAYLYVRRGAPPTLTQWDYRITQGQTSQRIDSKSVTITNRTSPPLTNDTWYFGIYAVTNAASTLTIQPASKTSQFQGNGAIPFSGGASFRTWAPNAQSVHVAGSFNGWNSSAAPMVSEGGGWWSMDIRGVQPVNQYKLVIRNGSQTLWKNDPWSRQVVNSVGNSVLYDHSSYPWNLSSNFQTPAWNDAVIYQMHVGTFNDAPGGSPGTFNSAISRLDYLRELGVNVIQLMPVQEFAGDYSWGYNPSHQFAIESAYGGPTNFKRFVDEAHSRGIAVLGDVVQNHWGPSDLDLWRYDGWFQGAFGGVFFYNDNRAHTPWGSTRPDYGRPEVRQFIVDVQREFLETYRLSGLRYDSTLNMRNTDLGPNSDGWNLLRWLNDDMDSRQGWKLNIAEDLQNDWALTRDTSFGGAGFDAQWSNFVHTARGVITPSDDNTRSMWAVRDIVSERYNGDPFERVIYTENHDENANGRRRVPSEIDSSNPSSYWAKKRSTLGAALVLTSPGIPMIFQGQEILEDGWFADTDPVDWTKASTHSGIRQLYKDLISLRRNLTGRTQGLRGPNLNFFHTNDSSKVVAYHRWLNGGANDDVVVVANFRNQTFNNYRIGFPRSGNWSLVFNSDWNGYSSDFGNQFSPNVTAGAPSQDGFAQSATVNLGPYTVLIYAKD